MSSPTKVKGYSQHTLMWSRNDLSKITEIQGRRWFVPLIVVYYLLFSESCDSQTIKKVGKLFDLL